MPLKVNLLATRMQSLYEEAERKCGQQQCEDAIGLLEEGVRIQSGNAQLYYQLGFCHSGGCRRHALTDPDMAAEYLRRALSSVGTSPASLLRARILDTLGNTLAESRKGPQTERLREAVACHREAAEIYQNWDLLEDWAREEFNQANTWCDLPASEFPDKWAQAIEHYQNALRVRTRAKDPQRFAAAVMNLGTAFRLVPSGDRAANVLKSIRCYRQALQIYTLDASPAQYADVCNNLGNACLSYPARDEPARKRHARDAVRHFERALEVWSSEENECQYALVQYNRGCAYLRLAAPEDFARAIACLSEAYEHSLSQKCPEIPALARAQLEEIFFSRKAQSG
jgi:tetratricopeptide (TPR) repeat protein